MPKLKTHKGAQRRFHITGTGKILRTKGGKSHLRRKKPSRVRHQYDKLLAVDGSERQRVKKLLPYSGVK
ncbi:MAG: 50S ribosomal protein L35 [Dehalococcoidia bacterium]|nr:50S ribosomal protein L35 [Dehalococcoidia bacterium]